MQTAFSQKCLPRAPGIPGRCSALRPPLRQQLGERGSSVVARANFAAGLAAAMLFVSSPSGAMMMPTPAVPVVATDQGVDEAYEDKQMEYILGQQDMMKKAQIEERRQELSTQIMNVETALEQKITEERAGAVSARVRGEDEKYKEMEARAAELEAQDAKVKSMAAKTKAQLDRVEMLERARTLMGQQAIRRAMTTINVP